MGRLRIVRREDLTICRIPSGRGFSYRLGDGTRLTDAQARARIKALGIPPAWTEVRIAAHERAHIQCCGMDAAGRVQYIYHPDWEERRAARKQKHLAMLTASLPRIRRRLRQDLGAPAGSKLLAVAIGVALIDRTGMRVGRERYLEANGTRGAGTLFARDVKIEDGTICIRFPAKSGKTAEYRLEDATLAEAITRIKTLKGKRLLQWVDEDGGTHQLQTSAINAYLKDIAGVPVRAKDFRTLHASALAAEALARIEPGRSVSARKRQMTGVTRKVADFLRNTPAICRKSYIAPCLFGLFDAGELGRLWAEASTSVSGLRERERRLAAVLEKVG